MTDQEFCTHRYFDGNSIGDDQSAYTGDDWDIDRWTATGGTLATVIVPYQDTAGSENYQGFGSAHAVGFNMAFCDGSVRFVTYAIGPTIHNIPGRLQQRRSRTRAG